MMFVRIIFCGVSFFKQLIQYFMYILFHAFSESLCSMLYRLQTKPKRLIYLYDLDNQQLRHSKSTYWQFLLKDNCEGNIFKLMEAQKPTGKLERGLVNERNDVSETTAKNYFFHFFQLVPVSSTNFFNQKHLFLTTMTIGIDSFCWLVDFLRY